MDENSKEEGAVLLEEPVDFSAMTTEEQVRRVEEGLAALGLMCAQASVAAGLAREDATAPLRDMGAYRK